MYFTLEITSIVVTRITFTRAHISTASIQPKIRIQNMLRIISETESVHSCPVKRLFIIKVCPQLFEM